MGTVTVSQVNLEDFMEYKCGDTLKKMHTSFSFGTAFGRLLVLL